MRLSPAKIEVIGSEIAIAWSDSTESFLQMEPLRRACPCAGCSGEPDLLGKIARPDPAHTDASFHLRGWQLVGGYAWQPAWADGHSTGLYTFDYLRRLGSLAAEAEA